MKILVKEVSLFEVIIADDVYEAIDSYQNKEEAQSELLQIAKNIGERTLTAVTYTASPQ